MTMSESQGKAKADFSRRQFLKRSSLALAGAAASRWNGRRR